MGVHAEEKQGLSHALIAKMEDLIHKISMENHEEEFLKDILAEDDLAGFVDVTLTECHVIDCIERNRLINAIGISQRMNITKGGISKITARLLKKGLIEAHRLEGNRKEIFYTLTPLGKKVFSIHEKLHAKVRQRFISLFDKYSDQELSCVSRFLSDMMEII